MLHVYASFLEESGFQWAVAGACAARAASRADAAAEELGLGKPPS